MSVITANLITSDVTNNLRKYAQAMLDTGEWGIKRVDWRDDTLRVDFERTIPFREHDTLILKDNSTKRIKDIMKRLKLD